MKRSTFFVVIAVCSMGAVATTVSAADLTNSTPTTTADDAKMPSTADFSNGPAGGGAALGTKDHIPTGAEFSNGPTGGAANDPAPRRMPTGAEFSNGPTGNNKE
jgi:hypothetical protein